MSDESDNQTFLDSFGEGEPVSYSEQEYIEWLDSFDWRFSTHYAKKGAPHSYIDLDKDIDDTEMFYKFAMYIRVNGEPDGFWNTDWPIAELDGYKYWALPLGNVGQVTVINRKPIDGYENYEQTPEKPTEGVNEIDEAPPGTYIPWQ